MGALNWLFKKRDPWEMGTCNGRVARRHRKTGEVQFVLWKAGEQGHKEDYWHKFGLGWGELFVPGAAPSDTKGGEANADQT